MAKRKRKKSGVASKPSILSLLMATRVPDRRPKKVGAASPPIPLKNTESPSISPENSAVSHRQLPAWFTRDWLWGLILVLAVILVYQPVWQAGFIWDDDDHVTANPCIIGPLGLAEIWTTSLANFFPLTLTTFWLE